MTVNRRRLMLGIGAALLVGGWGTTQLASRAERVVHSEGVVPRPKKRSSSPPINVTVTSGVARWDYHYRPVYIGGIVGMALGAGLIGFAVLRPTARKDE